MCTLPGLTSAGSITVVPHCLLVLNDSMLRWPLVKVPRLHAQLLQFVRMVIQGACNYMDDIVLALHDAGDEQ